MSMPRIWKSIPAQEVASTLHVEQHGPECRSCRSDITTNLDGKNVQAIKGIGSVYKRHPVTKFVHSVHGTSKHRITES